MKRIMIIFILVLSLTSCKTSIDPDDCIDDKDDDSCHQEQYIDTMTYNYDNMKSEYSTLIEALYNTLPSTGVSVIKDSCERMFIDDQNCTDYVTELDKGFYQNSYHIERVDSSTFHVVHFRNYQTVIDITASLVYDDLYDFFRIKIETIDIVTEPFITASDMQLLIQDLYTKDLIDYCNNRELESSSTCAYHESSFNSFKNHDVTDVEFTMGTERVNYKMADKDSGVITGTGHIYGFVYKGELYLREFFVKDFSVTEEDAEYYFEKMYVTLSDDGLTCSINFTSEDCAYISNHISSDYDYYEIIDNPSSSTYTVEFYEGGTLLHTITFRLKWQDNDIVIDTIS